MAQWILGLHIGHDRGAAILRDGKLHMQIAEERLDRRKYSTSPELPDRAISEIMRATGTTGRDINAIGISYTNVEIDKILSQMTEEISDRLDLRGCEVVGVSHHDAHAFSALFTSPYRDALVVVSDGSGDIVDHRLEAESVYHAVDGRLQLVARRLQDFGLLRSDRRNSFNPVYMSEVDKPKQISMGRKYEQFTYICGFAHGEAGKLMGLAAYERPILTPQMPDFSGLDLSLAFADDLDDVFQVCLSSGEPWHKFVMRNRASIASFAQASLELTMTEYIRRALETVPHSTLCAAGGVFLNCKLNHAILENTRAEQLHVVPGAGDDGQAVGAAFAAYHRLYGPPPPATFSPYLGPEYDQEEVERAIRHFGVGAKYMPTEMLIDRLAWELSNGRIVALFRGRSEFGPRALCHRSILADPRNKGMTECLNYLKGRESFRPLAAVITEEAEHDYFELTCHSAYMLLAAQVRPSLRDRIPAVTHVDGTSRVQAVAKNEEPFVHKLLESFGARTGVPVLINTSFNLRGEPIVETPHDAVAAYMRSALDILVMGNFYISSSGRAAAAKRLV